MFMFMFKHNSVHFSTMTTKSYDDIANMKNKIVNMQKIARKREGERENMKRKSVFSYVDTNVNC